MEKEIKGLIIKNSKMKILTEDIKGSSNLIEDFGFDSMQMIQLILDTEEHYGVIFDEDDLFVEQLSTFNSFKKLVERTLNKKVTDNI